MIAAVSRAKYLDAAEVQRLLDTCRDWAAKGKRGRLVEAVVLTALQTGLRVSELARLTCGDLDAERGLLLVFRLKRRPPSVNQEPLAISPELAQHLAGYTGGRDRAQAMFIGKRGAVTANGLARLWKVAVARAKLPPYSIHCARHTLATHLYAKTKDPGLVRKQLGHASINTTIRMYIDVPFETMQAGITGVYETKKISCNNSAKSVV